ncbi:hypothetical protein BSKO_05839 [Bryopsis sp. KO-2023]|nr:hypothetical protein BSKO_05839 [Bryopsis sp. KO-2023]
MLESILTGPGPGIIGFVLGSVVAGVTDIAIPRVGSPFPSVWLGIVTTVAAFLLFTWCRTKYPLHKYHPTDDVPNEVAVYILLGFAVGVWFCAGFTTIGDLLKEP